MIRITSFLLLVTSVVAQDGTEGETDPCVGYSFLLRADDRSVEVYAKDLSTRICDIRLKRGWYRIKGEIDFNLASMSQCQEYGLCGTGYPICLKDGEMLPEVNDGVVERTVCMKKPSLTPCHWETKIKIKHCGTFRVFYLIPPRTCSAAYCIREAKCKPNFCSPTGYAPGCERCTDVVVLGSVNVAALSKMETYKEMELSTIAFKCNFADPVQLPGIQYDITWFIDDSRVTGFTGIALDQLDSAMLMEDMWSDTVLNFMVRCMVRRRMPGSNPGQFFPSDWFFAGLEVSSKEITLLEGQTVTLMIRSTVPLAHQVTDAGVVGKFEIRVGSPTYQPHACAQGVTRVLLGNNVNCGIQLDVAKFGEWQILNVTAAMDNLLTDTKHTYLRLSLGDGIIQHPDRQLWKRYRLPEVQITIRNVDQGIFARTCYSSNDPHLRSGDGKTWDFHAAGEFILYRHQKFPISVHIKYRSCQTVKKDTEVHCNCGVAIRSYSSLMVIDLCPSPQRRDRVQRQAIPNYQNCNRQHIVAQKETNGYTFTLPTGTKVFVLSQDANEIATVFVHHSMADIGMSEGLCGLVSLDGNRDDDFTLRDGSISLDSKSFSENWKVNSPAESLFVANVNLDNKEPLIKYCRCPKDADVGNGMTFCTADTPASICPLQLIEDVYPFLRSCTERTARDMDSQDDVDDGPSGWQSDEDYERMKQRQLETAAIRQAPGTLKWSKAEATGHCESAFRRSAAADILVRKTNLSNAHFIKNCILDIEYTDDTYYTPFTVEAYKVAAREQFRRNDLFASSPEGQAILLELDDKDCTNECSYRGRCEQRRCYCDLGFEGDDCSAEKDEPLSDVFLSTTSCDKCNNNPCGFATVLGKGIRVGSTIHCRLTMFEWTTFGVYRSKELPSTTAISYHDGQVNCPLPLLDPKENVDSWGFLISVSKDNTNFSTNETYTIGSCYRSSNF